MASSSVVVALLLVLAVVVSEGRRYYTPQDVMFSDEAPLGAHVAGSFRTCVQKLTFFVLSVCKDTAGCVGDLTQTGCTRQLSVDDVRARCCPNF